MSWYVITGGPSSGKTAVISELSKLGYQIVPDPARAFFEQEMRKGRIIQEIRADRKVVQCMILDLKLKNEVGLSREKKVFFEYAVPDCYAYFEFYNLSRSEEAARIGVGRPYRKVFLLEQLPSFKEDGVRIENLSAAKRISELIENMYLRLNYLLVKVPVMSIKDRVSFILSRTEN